MFCWNLGLNLSFHMLFFTKLLRTTAICSLFLILRPIHASYNYNSIHGASYISYNNHKKCKSPFISCFNYKTLKNRVTQIMICWWAVWTKSLAPAHSWSLLKEKRIRWQLSTNLIVSRWMRWSILIGQLMKSTRRSNWLVTHVLFGSMLVCSLFFYRKDFKARSTG